MKMLFARFLSFCWYITHLRSFRWGTPNPPVDLTIPDGMKLVPLDWSLDAIRKYAKAHGITKDVSEMNSLERSAIRGELWREHTFIVGDS